MNEQIDEKLSHRSIFKRDQDNIVTTIDELKDLDTFFAPVIIKLVFDFVFDENRFLGQLVNVVPLTEKELYWKNIMNSIIFVRNGTNCILRCLTNMNGCSGIFEIMTVHSDKNIQIEKFGFGEKMRAAHYIAYMEIFDDCIFVIAHEKMINAKLKIKCHVYNLKERKFVRVILLPDKLNDMSVFRMNSVSSILCATLNKNDTCSIIQIDMEGNEIHNHEIVRPKELQQSLYNIKISICHNEIVHVLFQLREEMANNEFGIHSFDSNGISVCKETIKLHFDPQYEYGYPSQFVVFNNNIFIDITAFSRKENMEHNVYYMWKILDLNYQILQDVIQCYSDDSESINMLSVKNGRVCTFHREQINVYK